jgi:uncharacterized Zn finger protein
VIKELKTDFVVLCFDCGKVEMKKLPINANTYKNTKFSCTRCGSNNTQFIKYGWVKEEQDDRRGV